MLLQTRDDVEQIRSCRIPFWAEHLVEGLGVNGCRVRVLAQFDV